MRKSPIFFRVNLAYARKPVEGATMGALIILSTSWKWTGSSQLGFFWTYKFLELVGTKNVGYRSPAHSDLHSGGLIMRGVLLWLIGIPIPIIILLYLFHAI